ATFLQEVKERTLAAYEHQDYPFEELVEKVQTSRDLSRNPVFDVMFNFLDREESESGVELRMRPYGGGKETAKFDLTLYVAKRRESLHFRFQYRTCLFQAATIEYVIKQYEHILEQITEDVHKQLKGYGLFDLSQARITGRVAPTYPATEYERVADRVRRMAKAMPDQLAIECGNVRVTYAELEQQGNAVAAFLRQHVGEGHTVAVLMDSSPAFVAAVLGCMKSGNVFAPLDPGYPSSRIRLLLDQLKSDWVIASPMQLQILQEARRGTKNQLHVLMTEGRASEVEECWGMEMHHLDASASRAEEPFPHSCQEPGYVFFTSGTTGTPKAVLGLQQSLAQFIDWEIREFGVSEEYRVSQLTAVTFDPSLRDIFVPLCAGATLCIPQSREIVLSPERLKAWLEGSKITLTHLVPSIFRGLVEAMNGLGGIPELKHILLAGEMLRGQDVRQFYRKFDNQTELVNLYGHTETTLVKFYLRVTDADAERANVPIGQPIEGAEAFLLDRNMNPVIPGAVGEIYIRTPYRSAGYLETGLTGEVFVRNPYGTDTEDLLYRTGDLGRILPDGNMECVGRADYQVKIRGIRIEPGEVEQQLLSHPSVKDAAVVALGEAEEKVLCAYVVSEERQTVGALREHLATTLPAYMIPSFFMQLDKLPLTANGKLDRKALPEPDGSMATGTVYEAPSDSIEEKILDTWKRELRNEKIGINNNFYEVGGNSIKAIKIILLIESYYGINLDAELISSNFITVKKSAETIKGYLR
ncbi:MAG: amino acid adenylation domain protein, partial [Paenibacillus sp.]|nr:amino acid adenylation domain protein [Paenibacillus sp.]